MSAREAILRRLAATSSEEPLPAVYHAAPAEGSVTRFIERATEVGAEVHVIRAGDLPESIVRIVRAEAGADIVAWKDPLLEDAVEALRRAGVAVVSGETEKRETAASCAFGLTTVDYAIAETGTIILAAGEGRLRGASLLPARHLAVLPEERIYADLFALTATLGGPPPSALTFITGPSRSADIGLTPVRPAHGPMAVTILVIA